MGKKLSESTELVDKRKIYTIEEASVIVKKVSKAKFDETVEVHIKLGINPKQSDQIVRGMISLPYGIGKIRKIAVLAKSEKQKEAEEVGADIVGYDELLENISKEKIDFDVLVATPDVMKDLSRVAKVLGPKGLMPNPKSGTVTFEIKRTVSELREGRIEYKNDPSGIIHVSVGKVSFEKEKIACNIRVLLEAVIKAKPACVKGQYIRSISISSTMGPGIFIEHNA